MKLAMDGGQGDTMATSAPPAQCLWLWASRCAPSLPVLPPLWFSPAPLYFSQGPISPKQLVPARAVEVDLELPLM